jgi:hypothetical protein
VENRNADKKMELKIKRMNKKGIFFTILVMAMLSLFLVSYGIYSDVKSRGSINKRIETMNNFIFSIETDMSRQIYVSGYRAILAIENKITADGHFIANSQNAIREAIINGSIENENISLMAGYKLSDINLILADLGNKENLLIDYSIKEVNISQDDPWNVKIDVIVDSYIKDKGNLAYWNRTKVISSKIDIVGFEDPLYLINTNGKISNRINKTIYKPFVQGTNVDNLSIHSQYSYYIESTNAPSFLDRLEGKISANSNGIESLVYLPELSLQGMNIQDKSCVDYIYFSNNNPASFKIQGMPSWFEIDDAHVETYNLSGLLI